MLTSSQLGTAISAVLVGAIVLGWILHWLWGRAINQSRDDRARMADLVTRLHASDHARDRAEDARERAENLLASREAEMQTRMEAMQHRLDGAIEGREAELAAELREAKADADAAMGGLGTARRRLAELEAALSNDESQNLRVEVQNLSARLREREQVIVDLKAALEATRTTELDGPSETRRPKN